MFDKIIQTYFWVNGEKSLEIKGQIEEFIYQNDANSYTIAVFETEEQEIITVVGYLPFIAVRRLFKIKRKNGNTSRVWWTI